MVDSFSLLGNDFGAGQFSFVYRFGPVELLAKKKHKDMTKTF
jgi:hypothetical protein